MELFSDALKVDDAWRAPARRFGDTFVLKLDSKGLPVVLRSIVELFSGIGEIRLCEALPEIIFKCSL